MYTIYLKIFHIELILTEYIELFKHKYGQYRFVYHVHVNNGLQMYLIDLIYILSNKQTCLLQVFIRHKITKHGININNHIPSKQIITIVM
jgi:hypothetical protein